MKDSLRWSYALNQWNVRLDVFVRHEDQQRALKTVAACGFDTIELASGTGRWDNISRPEVILLNHGSHQGFLDFLRQALVQGVSSMFWDPQAPTEEEEGYAFRSTADPADADAIVEWSKPFVDFPALMKEIVTSGYDGWLTVEHDKAELGGGSYAEATAVAKWYIDNVLAEAEAEARAELGSAR